MNTDRELYRLMTWLSPSYPVGAYAFSHGLENAVETGLVSNAVTAREWIASILTRGNAQADLVFAAAAWDAASEPETLGELNDLALAFQTTAELRLESTAQGQAYLAVSRDTWPCEAVDALIAMPGEDVAYPVAVGAVAAGHEVSQRATLLAYAHAFAANLVSAAVRLVPLGQTDGQRVTAILMPVAEAAVSRALDTPVDEVATATPIVDLASMNHESQYTRLFRS